MYRERKLGTDDYARDAKRVRDNAIEWIKRAQSKRLGGLRKAPSSGAFLPASLMYFCSGQPMHFCCGVDSLR